MPDVAISWHHLSHRTAPPALYREIATALTGLAMTEGDDGWVRRHTGLPRRRPLGRLLAMTCIFLELRICRNVHKNAIFYPTSPGRHMPATLPKGEGMIVRQTEICHSNSLLFSAEWSKIGR